MIHSILVPLDGSSFAEQAIPLAASIAERHHASLTLAVVHPWGPAEDAPRPGSSADRELRDGEGIYLNRLMQKVVAAYSIPVHEIVLDGSSTGHTLVSFTGERHFDLVVASTHDHGKLSRFFSTGVARELADDSPVNSLFIKPQVEASSAWPGEFSRVLIGLDGSRGAECALSAAMALASPSATIVLAEVIPEAPAQRRIDAEQYLQDVTQRIQSSGRSVQPVALTGRNVASGLVSYARREAIDLIVVTTHFRRRLTRTVFGSVTDSVLHRAAVPVLVCHTIRVRAKRANRPAGFTPASSSLNPLGTRL
jgi:nucleotide-binding universal stress UspA family protein